MSCAGAGVSATCLWMSGRDRNVSVAFSMMTTKMWMTTCWILLFDGGFGVILVDFDAGDLDFESSRGFQC
eukprot:1495307-Rhodomonas_salina.1